MLSVLCTRIHNSSRWFIKGIYNNSTWECGNPRKGHLAGLQLWTEWGPCFVEACRWWWHSLLMFVLRALIAQWVFCLLVCHGPNSAAEKETQFKCCAARLLCGVSWCHRNTMYATTFFTCALCALSTFNGSFWIDLTEKSQKHALSFFCLSMAESKLYFTWVFQLSTFNFKRKYLLFYY